MKVSLHRNGVHRWRDLREKIHRQQTELTRLLRYLQQAAEGLAKAHTPVSRTVIQPDNIMITHDGFAKVLDPV